MRARTMVLGAMLMLWGAGAGATAIRPGEYPMQGRYVGVLPCVDCVGVWTEVVLSDPGVNAGQGSGTYVLTERFTGGAHGGRTVVTRGDWSTVGPPAMGSGQDNAFSGVIELRGAAQDGVTPPPRLFNCDHGRSLALLDAERHVVHGDWSSALHRVIPQPPRRFGPLGETQSGAKIDLEVGDEAVVMLPIEVLARYRDEWHVVMSPGASVIVYTVGGSGQGTRYSAEVELRAKAPGMQTLTLTNVANPTRKVQFRFSVAPRSGKPETCAE